MVVRLTQRDVVQGLFVLLIGTAMLFILNAVMFPTEDRSVTITMNSIGLVGNLVLFAAYRRGWESARFVYLAFVTLLIGVALDVTQPQWFYTTLVPVIAAIMAGPLSIIGSSLSLYILLLLRSGGEGPFVDIASLIFFVMIVGTTTLGQIVTITAQQRAADNARRAEKEQARAEAQAEQLTIATRQQAEQLEQQRRLLDLVTTLETPAVQLADEVLLAPLVGHIDDNRAETLMARLLEAASRQHPKLVVLDIAGVTVVDTTVVKALADIAQALRLLGCAVSISGMSSKVAMTLANNNITLTGVTTVRSPQVALEQYQFQHSVTGSYS